MLFQKDYFYNKLFSKKFIYNKFLKTNIYLIYQKKSMKEKKLLNWTRQSQKIKRSNIRK